MKIKNFLVASDTGDIEKRLPLPALTGPIIGLLYFIAVPFLGFAALILFIGQRIGQLVAAGWHRLVHLRNGEAGAHRRV